MGSAQLPTHSYIEPFTYLGYLGYWIPSWRWQIQFKIMGRRPHLDLHLSKQA